MNSIVQQKSPYITFLQAICAVSVVVLHTNGVFWIYSEEGYWKSANFIECLFYFAVPVFFMISGITLINFRSKYGIKEFFQRRFFKAVLPYVTWSLFGLLYNLYWKVTVISDIDVTFVLNGLLNSTFVKIYWFFPILFGIYLCIPLFASVPKNEVKTIFRYLFICGLILNILIPFVIKQGQTNITFPYPKIRSKVTLHN